MDPNKFGYQRKYNPFVSVGKGTCKEGHVDSGQWMFKSHDW